MEELAEVVAIDNGQITLVSKVKSTCNTCSQVDTCASGQVAKAIPHKTLSFVLPYPESLSTTSEATLNLSVGDCVIISLPETDVLHSALQVYLLPLAGLLSFSAFGQWLYQNEALAHELLALLIGLVGGYLGYRLAKFWQNKPSKLAKLQPKILRVITKPIDLTVSK